MACKSCGTGKDGSSPGCRNNGTCGTGGCNKLNVSNWLSDMVLPMGQSGFSIIEVRFKGSRKEFFHNKENIDLRVGDVIAVEASPGHDVGVVSMVGELVRFQLRKKNVSENSESIRTLYRKAKTSEVEKWMEVKDKENETLHRTRSIIQSLKLSMKLSDVEYQGDGKKATFFYTADDRVDFRELIKKLAEEFRIRVEMRQIGMRQEAGRLGGIGVCGRELCCSTWLTDFKTVSTSAARYQNLALNPAKLAGQCTKLKCCLNYELDSYMDALRDFPSTSIVLETEKGRAFHRKTDIFKRLSWYAFTVDERREQSELIEGGVAGNWVVLPVERVNEIIDLNKKGIRPPDLALPEEKVEKEFIPDYENVVGQDRIDRMDKLKKKKKKKKKKPSAENTAAQAQGGSAPHRPAPRPQQAGVEQKQNQSRPQGQPNQQRPKPNQPNQQRQQGQQNQQRPQQNQPNQPAQPNQNNPQRNQPNQNRPQENRPPRPQNHPRRDPPKQGQTPPDQTPSN
jgi:cell fate regulator YaaT (PSP1 superfamily)